MLASQAQAGKGLASQRPNDCSATQAAPAAWRAAGSASLSSPASLAGTPAVPHDTAGCCYNTVDYQTEYPKLCRKVNTYAVLIHHIDDGAQLALVGAIVNQSHTAYFHKTRESHVPNSKVCEEKQIYNKSAVQNTRKASQPEYKASNQRQTALSSNLCFETKCGAQCAAAKRRICEMLADRYLVRMIARSYV